MFLTGCLQEQDVIQLVSFLWGPSLIILLLEFCCISLKSSNYKRSGKYKISLQKSIESTNRQKKGIKAKLYINL